MSSTNQVFNGAAGELNGLFTQAADESAASVPSRPIRRVSVASQVWLMVSTRTRSKDVRAVIGSKTFALYAALFANSNKGDMSLFDYLTQALGSIRVSDRVPGVSSSAQRGICVLTASAEDAKDSRLGRDADHVRDPVLRRRRWQGHDHRDGAGQSPLYIPHGVDQPSKRSSDRSSAKRGGSR